MNGKLIRRSFPCCRLDKLVDEVFEEFLASVDKDPSITMKTFRRAEITRFYAAAVHDDFLQQDAGIHHPVFQCMITGFCQRVRGAGVSRRHDAELNRAGGPDALVFNERLRF